MAGQILERVVEVAVLSVAAWPAIAPCASTAFRRAFPGLALRLAGVVVAYAVGIALLVAFAPIGLVRGAAAAAVVAMVAVLWHSGVARGRAHGWPPGSLRPFALGPWTRQDFFSDQSRRLGSTFKTSQFLRPTACLVGLSAGSEFFRQHDDVLVSPPWSFGRFIPGGFLRHMPRERHAEAKQVLRLAMAREVYELHEAFIRDQFRQELARMAHASAGTGVPPRRHIQRAVFSIWVRLFFGIDPASAERARLKTLYRVIDIRNPSSASDRQIRSAVAEIVAIARAHTADGHSPGAGAGSFLEALARSSPASVDDPTIMGNLAYILHTTWADVSGLLQWIARMLTDHGQWADRLRLPAHADSAHEGGALSLSTRVVMETLRLEQSEYLYRATTSDVSHGGMVIPKGWLVRLCVRESHQDPAVFEHAQTFDPDRFLHRSFARREYAPFGAGLRHACLGEELTKTVGGIFAEELARGYHWQSVADGPAEHSAWRHWRPSSAWRIVLTPRGGSA